MGDSTTIFTVSLPLSTRMVWSILYLAICINITVSLPLSTRMEYTIPDNLHQLHSVPPPQHKDGVHYTWQSVSTSQCPSPSAQGWSTLYLTICINITVSLPLSTRMEYTIPDNLYQHHSVPPPQHKDGLEYTIPDNLYQHHSVPPPQHKDGLEYTIPDNLHQLHSVPPPQHKDGLEYRGVHNNHPQHPTVHPHPSSW